jgi:hypothetical protein
MHARQDEASSSKQKKREFAGKILSDISTVGRVRIPPPALFDELPHTFDVHFRFRKMHARRKMKAFVCSGLKLAICLSMLSGN